MEKKIWSILVAIALLVFSAASYAEQLPSPTMPKSIDAELVTSSGVAMVEDFTIQLVADTEVAAAALAEVQEFVQTEKIVNYFGAESMAAAAEFLPGNYDAERLMLAELYSLTVNNYNADYGVVDATFKFAAEYADDEILLGMVGIVSSDPAVGSQLTITWFPVPAVINDGHVVMSFSQEPLERISNGEAAIFVLLQDQK